VITIRTSRTPGTGFIFTLLVRYVLWTVLNPSYVIKCKITRARRRVSDIVERLKCNPPKWRRKHEKKIYIAVYKRRLWIEDGDEIWRSVMKMTSPGKMKSNVVHTPDAIRTVWVCFVYEKIKTQHDLLSNRYCFVFDCFISFRTNNGKILPKHKKIRTRRNNGDGKKTTN